MLGWQNHFDLRLRRLVIVLCVDRLQLVLLLLGRDLKAARTSLDHLRPIQISHLLCCDLC